MGAEPPSNVVTAETVIRRLYGEVWNNHRDDIIDELFDPEFQTPAAPGMTGGAAKLAVIEAIATLFPMFTSRSTTSSSPPIASLPACRTLKGTDTGGFHGRLPTGRTITGWGSEHFGFRGGRVLTNWIGADWLGVLIQLGVLADPWSSLAAEPHREER